MFMQCFSYSFIKLPFFISCKVIYMSTKKDDLLKSVENVKTFSIKEFFNLHHTYQTYDRSKISFYTNFAYTSNETRFCFRFNVINFFFYSLYYSSRNDITQLKELSVSYNTYLNIGYPEKRSISFLSYTEIMSLYFSSKINPIILDFVIIELVANTSDLNKPENFTFENKKDLDVNFYKNVMVNEILVIVFTKEFVKFESKLVEHISLSIITLYIDLIEYLDVKQQKMSQSEFNTFILDKEHFYKIVEDDRFFEKIVLKFHLYYFSMQVLYSYCLGIIVQKKLYT